MVIGHSMMPAPDQSRVQSFRFLEIAKLSVILIFVLCIKCEMQRAKNCHSISSGIEPTHGSKQLKEILRDNASIIANIQTKASTNIEMLSADVVVPLDFTYHPAVFSVLNTKFNYANTQNIALLGIAAGEGGIYLCCGFHTFLVMMTWLAQQGPWISFIYLPSCFTLSIKSMNPSGWICTTQHFIHERMAHRPTVPGFPLIILEKSWWRSLLGFRLRKYNSLVISINLESSTGGTVKDQAAQHKMNTEVRYQHSKQSFLMLGPDTFNNFPLATFTRLKTQIKTVKSFLS
jgi:hypothetical protein